MRLAAKDSAMCWVASFYRFHAVPDPERLRTEVASACQRRSLTGTVLIAEEGVNGALAGPRQSLASVIGQCFPDLPQAAVKWSETSAERPAFRRLKVRTKPEIVTFGQTLTAPEPFGERLGADAWQRLLDDPEVLVLDVRNRYETSVGAFRGARCPDIDSFREFAAFAERELAPARHPAVGIYCTGGIRCEKAAALLHGLGFDAVHQLDGGILRYLQETNDTSCGKTTAAEASGRARNAFEGECFVFDGRVSVNAQLKPGSYRLCDACGWPLPLPAGDCGNRNCIAAA